MHKQIRNPTPCTTMYTSAMRDSVPAWASVFVIAVNSWFPSLDWRHLIEKMSTLKAAGETRSDATVNLQQSFAMFITQESLWCGLTASRAMGRLGVEQRANYAVLNDTWHSSLFIEEKNYLNKELGSWNVSDLSVCLQCTFEEAFELKVKFILNGII